MLSLLVVATPEKCSTLVFSLSHKTLHSADTFFFYHYEALGGLHCLGYEHKISIHIKSTWRTVLDQDWGVFFRAGVDWHFLGGSGSENVSGVVSTLH